MRTYRVASRVAVAAFAVFALAACSGTIGGVSQSGSPGAWIPSAAPHLTGR